MATIAPLDRAEIFFADPSRYLSGNHRIALRAEIVREMVGDQRGSILDLGCGNGAVASALGGVLTLIDRSPAMVAEAQRLNSSARTVCADLHGYCEGGYDLVLCIGVLAHTPRTKLTLAAVARNMKPGGLCVVQFSDARRPINRLGAVILRMANRHYRPTTRDEVIEAALACGLSLVAERSHLLMLPGMQRLLGRWLLPYDRTVRRVPWLARHATDTLLLFERR